MMQGPLNPNISFLREKLWPASWKLKFTNVIEGKKTTKITNKTRKNSNFEKQKIAFLSHVPNNQLIYKHGSENRGHLSSRIGQIDHFNIRLGINKTS